MDASFRTPLLDSFRRGEAPRDVRILAASGQLAPRAHEQLALLVLLSQDEDAEIRATTERTIGRLPRGPLAAFLARNDVNPEIRAFFAARGLAPEEAAPSGDTSAPLLDLADAELETTETEPVGESCARPEAAEADAGQETAAGAEDEERRPAGAARAAKDTPESERRGGTSQRLALMDVGQRVKVAMLGSREERNILIRDSNRLVAAAVLSSPKLTESEVESIARMANVSDEVLRIVGTSRAWTKNYNVISALTRNPKTPIAISMSLLSRLTSRDVKMLSTDRNIPEPVRVAARKQAIVGDSRRQ